MTNAANTEVTTPASPGLSIPETPQGAGIVGAVITVVGGIMWLRRKISRDNVEIAKDTAEKNLLKTVTDERDRYMKAAEQAWAVRAEDAKLIGQLTSEVKHLTSANETLVASVQSMRQEIHDLRNIIQSSMPKEVLDRLAALKANKAPKGTS